MGHWHQHSDLTNMTRSGQPLIKYQLTNINYISLPSTILGSGDIVVNETRPAPSMSLWSSEGRQVRRKHITKKIVAGVDK